MKRDNTKLRLILVCQLLMNESDPEHPLTIVTIGKLLKERYNVDASRNTLQNDLNTLKAYGFPLEAWRSTQNRYYYNGWPFETAELKLLIDAVTASRFITERESQELIGKITKLTTPAQAQKLRRHIYVDGRVKTDNERGYYIVDAVNEAIETGRRISFQYTDYDGEKNRILRHDGRIYVLSPYALLWDGDYYYTIGWLDPADSTEPATALPADPVEPTMAFPSDTVKPIMTLPVDAEDSFGVTVADAAGHIEAASSNAPGKISTGLNPCTAPEGSLRTFRLDRIAAQPEILDEAAVPAPKGFDVAYYRKSVFRMFGTDEPVEITLLCRNTCMRAIIDNFGTDAMTEPVDEDHFRATVTVCPSPTFYRWVFGWGWDGSIIIEGPENVQKQYRKMLRKALRENH